MSIGLVCFMIKKASNFEMPSVLGPTIHGGLVGGALGALGGGIHGYMTAPEEVDEYTGQVHSDKWGNALSGAGKGALIGGGIGGVTGLATGWNNNTNWLQALKDSHPKFHDKLLRDWRMTNITKDLSNYNAWPKVP